jgi:putative hydrolase of the HAD superfamily
MIFFDIDGTLVDHKGAERAAALAFQKNYVKAFPESADAFAARWHTVAEKHVRRHLAGELSFQGQRRARLRELFAHHSSLTDAEADGLFVGYLMKYEENWSLYPDVMPCLEELENQRLGIISNGDSKQQREKLQKINIAARFPVVMISGDIGCAKPAAGIFHMVCKMAQEKPEECIYVGDDFETDAIGSRQVGMVGIWLNRGDSDHPDEAPMIKTLGELKRQIA